MELIERLEKEIGGHWIGLTFHTDSQPPSENPAAKPMRLCESIKEAYTGPFVLTRELVNCPGAQRSLGWEKTDDALKHKMANGGGLSPEIASKLLSDTPHIETPVTAVTVGDYRRPDLAVSYLQPADAMKLIRLWQRADGSDLMAPISSVLAVCGNVIARAYITGRISMSFGCPESRVCGKIGRDRLAVGIPYHIIERLL
jgi:uncharacterized protein (DUF169 family)